MQMALFFNTTSPSNSSLLQSSLRTIKRSPSSSLITFALSKNTKPLTYLIHRTSATPRLHGIVRVSTESIAVSEKIEVQPVITGGDGGGFGEGGGGGGDGGKGGGGDGGEREEGEGGEESGKVKKMSMSQKLTLGYAALVGVGGLMGYIKGGSQKSLAAGGLSALLLYYVYTQLPYRPAFASSIGMGLSAALLVVMGSRFKKSGKIFPAGVVSFVSLVMTGGYLHGIMRSLH